MPKHSAYRSGHLVQQYKKAYKEKHNKTDAYRGKGAKPLATWFKESWRNTRGQVGYQKKDDIYRPTKRVSSKTATTMSELSKKEIKKAKETKAKTGRVPRFSGVQKSTRKTKKYMLKMGGRTYHFGQRGFGQFKDQTKLKLYKNKDTNDSKQRKLFWLRHTGKHTKKAAMEEAKRVGHIAKFLAIKFLW